MARTVLSTPTTITVNSSSTALSSAASTMVSGEFKAFFDTTYWTRVTDPRGGAPNYYPASPTEDGANALGHTLIDWGSSAVYDPVAKQVMWACNGANPGGSGSVRIYSWQYSTYSVYHELANPDYFGKNVPAGTWTTERGIKAVTETDPDCIVHFLRGNALDVTGRKFYRKKFRTKEYYIRDLTTGAWTVAPSPSQEVDTPAGGLEFIPTRGSLWLAAGNRATDRLNVWEITNPAVGGGSILINETSLGSQFANLAPACAYNPRAFGGAGGVLIGSSITYKVTTPASGAPVIYSAGTPVSAIQAEANAIVCKDPAGDGWLHFVRATGKIYRTNGTAAASTWQEVATMPATMTSADNLVVCPIDDYGVVWCFGSGVVGAGATNDHYAWLWKP